MNGRNQSQYKDLAPEVARPEPGQPGQTARTEQPERSARPEQFTRPGEPARPGQSPQPARPAPSEPTWRQHRGRLLTIPLRLLAAAGLAVDAYVHTDLAGQFATGGTLSETRLFLIQGSLAAAAALGLVVRGRRLEAGFGFLVGAAALGAVLLYRYVDVGGLGPLPNMYDPAWYPEKTLSVIAEAVAVLACAGLLALRQIEHRRRRHPG